MGSDYFSSIIEWTHFLPFYNISIGAKINITNIDWAHFKAKMEKFRPIVNSDNYLACYDHLKECINNSLTSSGGKEVDTKDVRITPPPTIWWNKQCSDLIKGRRALERLFKRQPSPENFDSHLLIQKKAKSQLTKVKRNSAHEFLTSLNPQRNLQLAWNIIKAHKSRFNISHMNTSNSSEYPEFQKAIDKLAKYPFTQAFNLDVYESNVIDLMKDISHAEVRYATNCVEKNQLQVQTI
uniref:Uncharacterized protein n=1 Tax=Bracon brevicornis TaxID=1563983 RepID=A0A6V7JQN2_9HYME